MQQAELETNRVDQEQEAARLAALKATGILDTPPEPSYDAITRLAAEYFQADASGLAFGDESRIWVKSCWGQNIRELPKKNSIFEMVAAVLSSSRISPCNSRSRPRHSFSGGSTRPCLPAPLYAHSTAKYWAS